MKTNFGKALQILVGLLVLAFLAGCSTGNRPAAGTAAPSESEAQTGQANNILDKIVASGTIKIAVPEDTPLFGSLAADGSYEGYDMDIAKSFPSHRAGRERKATDSLASRERSY